MPWIPPWISSRNSPSREIHPEFHPEKFTPNSVPDFTLNSIPNSPPRGIGPKLRGEPGSGNEPPGIGTREFGGGGEPKRCGGGSPVLGGVPRVPPPFPSTEGSVRCPELPRPQLAPHPAPFPAVYWVGGPGGGTGDPREGSGGVRSAARRRGRGRRAAPAAAAAAGAAPAPRAAGSRGSGR